jgi:hypothetical protein
MFSFFTQTRRNDKSKKIYEIREMIKTPESEFLFPERKSIINYIKSEPEKYTLKLTKTWNNSIKDFTVDILKPLSKKGIKFPSYESFKEWILTPDTLEELNSNFINKLYEYLKRVQITQYNNTQIKNLRSLLNYERKPYIRGSPIINKNTNPLNNITVETRIQRILNRQPPLEKELILWRGQHQDFMVSPSWFSTSSDKNIAKIYGPYLFKIHVQPGVKVLDLYKEYKNTYGIKNPVDDIYKIRAYMRRHDFIHPIAKYTRNYKSYKEHLVEGGGKFYKSINEMGEGIEEGFTEVYNTSHRNNKTKPVYYETYYFPPAEPLEEIEWSNKLYSSNNSNKSNKSSANSRLFNLTFSRNNKIHREPNIIENIEYPTNLLKKK